MENNDLVMITMVNREGRNIRYSGKYLRDILHNYNIAKIDDINNLKWAINNGYKIKDATLHHAKNVEIIKYLLENGIKISDTTCEKVASYGNLDTLKYIHDKYNEMCRKLNKNENGGIYRKLNIIENICVNAAYRGNKDIVEYAKNNGYIMNDNILKCAIMSRNIDTIEYILDNINVEHNEEIMEHVFLSNSLEVLQLMCKKGYYTKIRNDDIQEHEEPNGFGSFKYAKNYEISRDNKMCRICNIIAEKNNAEMLDYLFKTNENIVINEQTYINIKGMKDFEMKKYENIHAIMQKYKEKYEAISDERDIYKYMERYTNKNENKEIIEQTYKDEDIKIILMEEQKEKFKIIEQTQTYKNSLELKEHMYNTPKLDEYGYIVDKIDIEREKEMLKKYNEMGDIYDLCIRTDDINMLKRVHRYGYKPQDETYFKLIKYGNTEKFKLLCELNEDKTKKTKMKKYYYCAMSLNNIDIMKYLWENEYDIVSEYDEEECEKNKKEYENAFMPHLSKMYPLQAIHFNDFEALKYFHNKGVIMNSDIYYSTAIDAGNLKIFKYLCEINDDKNKNKKMKKHYERATELNDNNIVKYLLENEYDIINDDTNESTFLNEITPFSN